MTKSKNSTQTRVEPLFDHLYSRDSSGLTWLPLLIGLPSFANKKNELINITFKPIKSGKCWGSNELKLFPPQSLLLWLAENIGKLPMTNENIVAGNTSIKRKQLANSNPLIVKEARELLSTNKSLRGWHVLEGASHPDVFIETENMVIVIEGKRTEKTITTKTDWMPNRHQMLRHIDCAYEIANGRKLYGFFIVEGEPSDFGLSLPKKWIDYCQKTISTDAISNSLPHRTPAEKDAISNAFIGATTWQIICNSLNVDSSIFNAYP